MEIWMLTAAANVIMVAVYAGIATFMVRGIHEGGQWRSNPIAVATAAVFVSCTIGHGMHLAHVLPPFSTLLPEQAAAGRAMFSDWRLVAWDGLTASVAAGYWLIRKRLAVVYEGSSLCEDIEERQRHAVRVRERVIAGVAHAEAQLAQGDREAGLRTLEHTLDEGKDIITTLMGTPGKALGPSPGHLRRETAP